MKNIHVLPTEIFNPLGQQIWIRKNGCYFKPTKANPIANNLEGKVNVYITSDEYIGLSYYLDGNLVRKGVIDDKEYWEVRKDYKKIILTTDQDLIKDGVQAIDDELLEWFVKNPSCEEVEIRKEMYIPQSNGKISDGKITHEISLDPSQNTLPYYKIIIPKEEPKQFKGRGMLHYSGKIIGGEPKQENTAEYIDRHLVEAMVEVAKQKIYSEEEVEDLIYKVCGTVARLQGITLNGNHIDTAYKQFKNK